MRTGVQKVCYEGNSQHSNVRTQCGSNLSFFTCLQSRPHVSHRVHTVTHKLWVVVGPACSPKL